jgi:hypothetical protein
LENLVYGIYGKFAFYAYVCVYFLKAITEGQSSSMANDLLRFGFREPTDKRIFVVASALMAGYTVDQLYDLTKV